MKIIDISQEIYSCAVFPGDPAPGRTMVGTIREGNICNLSKFSMGSHNGTHVDAPYHFYDEGKPIDALDLGACVGKCYVTFEEGPLTAEKAQAIVDKAKRTDAEAAKRLLIGGNMNVTLESARILAKAGLLLYGNESQTVGPMDAPAPVHHELLREEIVLLEGIRLTGVEEGVYFLNAAPLNLGGNDGAPCRAILIGE